MGIAVRASGMTDVGMARKHNEDCYEIDREHWLYVVADGMGGHSHGEVASRIAVDSIREFIRNDGPTDEAAPRFTEEISVRDHASKLKNAVRSAHDSVLKAIHQDTALQGMGTTVVGFLVKDGIAALAHVGDSRAYRLRDDTFEVLTQDHTWVHEQVVAGYLTEDQARTHPLKNVVTRALGSEKEVMVDLQEINLQVGDIYLICSDGLTTMMEDRDIEEMVRKGDPLDDTCKALIDEANQRGGLDNVTVILLEVVDSDDADE